MANPINPTPSDDFENISFNEAEDGSLEAVDNTPDDSEEGDTEDPSMELSQEDVDTFLDRNLVDELLLDSYVESLEETLVEGLAEDLESLEEHFETIKQGMDLLGIKLEESGTLGGWSCGASHPLITENAIKFQAAVVNELDTTDNLVKTRIVGKNGNDKLDQQANRVKDFMNYYLPEEMDHFFSESAKCALGTALVGTGFKKNYWDPATESIQSEYLRADQVIINWESKSLEKAYRYTELRPSSNFEIITGMNNGIFTKIDLDNKEEAPEGDSNSTDLPVLPIAEKIQEILGVGYDCERLLAYHYIYLDLHEMLESEDEEQLEETTYDATNEKYYEKRYLPFIVIQELYSNEILGIYANWNKGDATHRPKQYITDYHFVRGFGFYSLGYIHVLGNFAKMLTSTMRSIVDAGTLVCLQGGFKLRGTKIAGDAEVTPGEFIEVESAIQDITKAIMPLPFKEPSAVLKDMYTILEGRGQAFANATEGVVQGATNYGPVGTTMALLDASAKLNTAIIRDFHRSRRREFKIIARLMKENLGPEYPYEVDGEERTIFGDDFSDRVDILPVSDPNIPSHAQRLAMARERLNIVSQFPQIHNAREALKDIYKAMGEQNLDRLLPPPEEAQPLDPLGDFMAASQNKPIRAFPGQDHDAHVAFKQAILQNPEYQNSEFFAPVLQALAANIREHMVLKLAERINSMAPAQNEVAQAQAAQQLTQMQQQLAQAAANAQDPAAMIAQAQVEKVKNDAKRIESSEIKDFAKLALEKQRLDLDAKKLEAQEKQTQDKIRADLIKHDMKNKSDFLKGDKQYKEARANKAIDILGNAAMKDAEHSHKELLTEVQTRAKLKESPTKKPKE